VDQQEHPEHLSEQRRMQDRTARPARLVKAGIGIEDCFRPDQGVDEVALSDRLDVVIDCQQQQKDQ